MRSNGYAGARTRSSYSPGGLEVAMPNQHEPQLDADSPLMRRATTHMSIVVGCYNAARHLEKRLVELVAFLDGIDRPYEILIVEDGSVDDSLPILRRLEASL